MDVTIIVALSLSKNHSGEANADTHQKKRCETWHFDIRPHIGADANSVPIHIGEATAVNTGGVTSADAPLHAKEMHAFCNARYTGVAERDEHQDSTVTWYVMTPGKWRFLLNTLLGQGLEKMEHAKASVRAKVENRFPVVKNLFKHRRVCYCGLAKNTAQLLTLFDSENLMLAKSRLIAF